MLNIETKRHIDAARQILVGVVPNPASQIDQITNALIYKFMDDMDQTSIEAGGKASFFVGNLERYAWTRLMSTRIGNQERMNLYVEALEKFSQAKQLSDLFREIFKSAYLPYRSPETLGLFLKEIDYFDYSHPEELGTAYEYLLSIMSSQGDAGQFRTPRHIIDFIVEIVNPNKNDKVLDPACGTGGFLVSSYRHILKQHDRKNGSEKKKNPLTPDDRKRLMQSFEGYDIDPTMVRIAQVNMYLHGFKKPKIHQYDTLSRDERWKDKFDVILANPPFMSPKGGINPHNKFSIQSTRSEVLFVDYIMYHLKPQGRGGIIVPEGIIFQSGTAYKQLRKILVEGFLAAVISLPAGVFNPYSGVKTSILILDKQLAKKTDSILFAKIEHDGFNLGAQRRPVDENDLPMAAEYIKGWLSAVRTGKPFEAEGMANVHLVKKQEIAESGEFNLSGERYRKVEARKSQKWPMVELGEVSVVDWGNTKLTKKSYIKDGKYLGVSATGCDGRIEYFEHEVGVIVLSAIGANCGRVFYPVENFVAIKNTITFTPDHSKIEPKFLFYVMENNTLPRRGAGQPFMTKGDVKQYKILLPSLDVQREIVAEIDGYQKIIDGARQIISAYRPHIPLDPDWPNAKIGDVVDIMDSRRKPITKSDRKPGPYPYYGATGILDYVEDFIFNEDLVLVGEDGAKWDSGEKTAYAISGKTWVNNHAHVLRPKRDEILDVYLIETLNQMDLSLFITGVTVPKLNQNRLRSISVPLPPLEAQKKIVAEIEKEQQLVDSNKELIAIFEQKIKEKLTKLWSE